MSTREDIFRALKCTSMTERRCLLLKLLRLIWSSRALVRLKDRVSFILHTPDKGEFLFSFFFLRALNCLAAPEAAVRLRSDALKGALIWDCWVLSQSNSGMEIPKSVSLGTCSETGRLPLLWVGAPGTLGWHTSHIHRKVAREVSAWLVS